MAALYLHNAVFTPEPPEISRLPHSRNVSTISTTTLQPPASEQSHLNEPLLHSTTPDSLAYIDLISRQPTLVDEPNPLDWGPTLTLVGDPPTLQEQKTFWEKTIRRRLKRLRLLMRTLELLFGSWAIYNTTRYFIAFTTYDSVEGQLVSLALGTCTGISFAFLAAAAIFNFFKLHLLMHSVPLSLLTFMTISSQCLSSLTLVAPAITNMVMLFVWRHRSDTELSTEKRCRIDIDVIWSGTKQVCPKPYGWGTWMALSVTRLGITVVLITLYYAFLVAYERTRRPSKWVNPRRLDQSRLSEPTRPTTLAQTAQVSSHSLVYSTMQHQLSRSTVVSHAPSKKSTLHPSRSAASTSTSSDSGNTPRAPPVDLGADIDRETTGIVDRFRSLVSQITRETDQAIDLARSETASESSSDSQPSLTEQTRDFYQPPMPPSIGYNEFGQPYPPEESVPMLNGIIRRMPTIESMGSRELTSTNRGSSVYSGSLIDRLAGANGSRPPTRNTLSRTDYTGSEPPSRTGSLSLRASDILGSLSGTGASGAAVGNTSEVGELIKVGEKRGSPSSPSPLSQTFNLSAPQSNAGIQGIGSHSSRASSTATAFTYYTATMGSASSAPPNEGA